MTHDPHVPPVHTQAYEACWPLQWVPAVLYDISVLLMMSAIYCYSNDDCIIVSKGQGRRSSDPWPAHDMTLLTLRRSVEHDCR